ncbi:hypothetical protein D3C87_812720 [compost metagenome]
MAAFDFAAAKATVRRVVQTTLGVPALYRESDMADAPVALTARWHNKIDRFGDIENQGYAEFIQGIDRIVLIPSDTPALVFKKDVLIEFPAYGKVFTLQVKEKSSGPLEEIWQAAEL